MKKQLAYSLLVLVALVVFPSVPSRADGPATAPTAAKKKIAFSQYVHARVGSILDGLAKDDDYAGATASLQTLFDQAVLYSPADRPDAIREADFALRLVSQLSQVPDEQRKALLPYLRAHPSLAQTLAFLILPDQQPAADVYELLDKLREKRGEKISQFETLTAAICVVHYRTRTIRANENRVTSADPIDIFDYYSGNENRMFFGIKNVPAELLIYVVDTTASIPEMRWALAKYAGDKDVGKLFFDIKYDYDYLKSGSAKKLTTEGFNLPNILTYGGVCVDQSYFATTVGKAIGVPATMDEGTSGDAGHAWVGFLQLSGRSAAWDFDYGRYQSYQGVEGNVQDPQTRQDIPDCQVSLLGELIGTKPVDRQNAAALTDAAHCLEALQKSQTPVSAPPTDEIGPSTMMAKPRACDTAAELGFIESALKQSVAYTPAWFMVRDLAVNKELSLKDKRHWSELLLRLGAQRYPDFTLSILMPMIQTIDDPKEQDSILTNILSLFAARKDLSASILMAQASLWQTQNQTNRAGQCYMQVVTRYCNDGPFVLSALTGAEQLLRDSNRSDKIVTLYAQAWGQTSKPGDWAPEFVEQSNWYRIGQMYADRLRSAGDMAKAATIEATLRGSPAQGGKNG
jgi:hypothetical protein